MESQISHNIADLFTARPKAYSINTIKQLTKIRMLFKNNQNIKKLYLNNFNSNNIITINKEELNFDVLIDINNLFHPMKANYIIQFFNIFKNYIYQISFFFLKTPKTLYTNLPIFAYLKAF